MMHNHFNNSDALKITNNKLSHVHFHCETILPSFKWLTQHFISEDKKVQNTLKLPQVPLRVKTFQVLSLNAYQNNDHAWQ